MRDNPSTAIESRTDAGFPARSNEKPFDWLSRKEAAIYLTRIGHKISVRTLEKLAEKNNARGGPPFNRARKKGVTYQRADLDRWAYLHTERIT